MAKQRLASVDGLRGVAAGAVMVGHWGEFVRLHGAPELWFGLLGDVFLRWFSFGRTGIVAFFCISGFVVPFSFRGRYPLIAFPLSRFFRLYPAYWLSIFVAAAILLMTHEMPVTLTQVAVNMTMVQLLTHQPHLLGVYWTLTIELMFYAVCYGMFAAGWLHRPGPNMVAMAAFLGIAIAAGAYRWAHPASNLPVGVPTYLAAMHFGTLARLRVLEHRRMAGWLYPAMLALLVAGAMLANTLAYYRTTTELVGWVASDLGYLGGVALFLLAIHRQWFTGRVVVFLGLISYSTYLFHMAVIRAVVPFWAMPGNWYASTLAWTPVYVAVTLAVATLVHRVVEVPAIRMGRRIDARIEAAGGAGA